MDVSRLFLVYMGKQIIILNLQIDIRSNKKTGKTLKKLNSCLSLPDAYICPGSYTNGNNV